MGHIFEYTVFAILLGGLVWLPGYALERAAFRGVPGALRPLARLVLGLVAWLVALFTLASVGALRGNAIAACAAVGGLAAGMAHRRFRAVPDDPGVPVGRGRTGGSLVAWALVAIVLVPFYLLALGPQVSWDADVYHLTLPRLFLESGGFRSVPLSVYATWPLGTELFFAAAMTAKGYVLAKLVHFGFGLLTLYVIAAGCRTGSQGAPLAGATAALLFLANPVVLSEIHIAYVDLAVAFFFSAGFLFALRAATQAEDAGPMLLLAGLCAGAMAGLKVTGFVGAGVLGALQLPALCRANRAGAGGAALRRFALAFALPVLVLLLPWLARAYAETGNPIYPLLHGWFGGIDWSPTLAIQFSRWQDGIGMGRGPLDYLLLPLRAVLEGGIDYAHFDGEIGAFWIAAVPFAIWFGRREPAARFALSAAGLYFVSWALSSQQMRFLIPMLPLLCIATGVALGPAFATLGVRLGEAAARRAALLLVAIVAGAFAFVYRDPMERGLRLGARYGSEIEALRTAAKPEIFQQIERVTPKDAVLLFVNTNRGFFSPREYLADSFFQASQIADWLRPVQSVAELRALLDARGVTHVLFEKRDWGIRYPRALRELLTRREQTRRVAVSADRRTELYELLPPGQGVESRVTLPAGANFYSM